jgi:hypothetical protein
MRGISGPLLVYRNSHSHNSRRRLRIPPFLPKSQYFRGLGSIRRFGLFVIRNGYNENDDKAAPRFT